MKKATIFVFLSLFVSLVNATGNQFNRHKITSWKNDTNEPVYMIYGDRALVFPPGGKHMIAFPRGTTSISASYGIYKRDEERIIRKGWFEIDYKNLSNYNFYFSFVPERGSEKNLLALVCEGEGEGDRVRHFLPKKEKEPMDFNLAVVLSGIHNFFSQILGLF